jgi:ParB family chromosome partitioning protein
MSSRDRLSRLTADLLAAVPAGAAPAAGAHAATSPQPGSDAAAASEVESSFPALGRRPPGKRTGPGELLAFRGEMLATESELARLREQLRQHGDALPTRRLDASDVVPSRWANRHEASFAAADFLRFKADIESAGGNVQPILVRPLEGTSGKFEVVFGHRRRRACAELGLRVLATIWTEPMSDVEMFAAMDRENRERADLSPWEQGTMYRRALEDKMFPSMRRLADTLGVSHTWVRMALAVAEVPAPVLDCFRSPLELQVRHAAEINAAFQTDRKGVLKRAEKLAQAAERLPAAAVVSVLVGKALDTARPPRQIRLKTKVVASLSWNARGQATIRFLPRVLHAANVDAVVAAIGCALDPAPASDEG